MGFAIGHGLSRLHRDRPGTWAWIGGAAGLGPDFDVFLSPLAQIDALHWLAHRGITHSLLGAPLAGGAFASILAATARRWPTMARFRVERRAWLVVVLASWNQCVLDGVSHGGAAVLFPFIDERISLELYHWMAIYLAPVSLFAFVQRFRSRWDDGRVARAAIAVLLVLLLVGGVRAAWKPDGSYATQDPRDWIVVDELANGTIHVVALERGRVTDELWFPEIQHPAIAALQGSLAHKAFRFEAIGPVAFDIEHEDNGTAVIMTDTVGAMELQRLPSWTPSWAKARMAEDVVRRVPI